MATVPSSYARIKAQNPTIWDTCNPAPGFAAGDIRNAKALTSVKDCRLTPKHAPKIRVKSSVKPTGGTNLERDRSEDVTATGGKATRTRQANPRKGTRPTTTLPAWGR